MGFLKFLKREKKEDALEELDLPPEPPPLEGFNENIPELPDFPDFGEEKISAKEEMPKFDFPEEEENTLDRGKESMPEFPSFPEMEENPMPPISPITAVPQIPVPEPSIVAERSESDLGERGTMPEPQAPEEYQAPEEEHPLSPEAYPKIGRRIFEHERRVMRERPRAKTIYVKVDNFKAMLGTINIVRSDLRKSDEALTKLESIKNGKDKSFDKVKSSLDDLQKKLIFIDKTLFKGE